MTPRPTRRERVSAWAWRMLFLLVAGFAMTVAVSWALALLVPHRGLTKRYNMIQYTDAAGRIRSVWTETLEVRRAGMSRRVWVTSGMQPGATSKGIAWAELSRDTEIELGFRPKVDRSWGELPRELAREGTKTGSGMDDARGWPWPALWCSLDAAGIDNGTSPQPVTGGFRVSEMKVGSAHYRALPLMPVWRGLALDTAFYGAAIGVLIAAVRPVRGVVRRLRGHCRRCGYDLRHRLAEGCPECGWNRADPDSVSTQESAAKTPDPSGTLA